MRYNNRKIFYSLSLILLFNFTGCAGTPDINTDNIPMYGQPEINRPAYLRDADEMFINNAVAETGSRKKASKVWWAKGEKYFNQGNLDDAMRRYNQSWLLNPKNYQPYWGFARIMLQQNRVDEGIKYLEMTEKFIDSDYQRVALFTAMGTAYTYKANQDPAYFEKANKKFSESIKLDPAYPDSWGRWAYSLYKQGRFKEAWSKVKKAQSLNARPFSPKFLSALKEKLPGKK